MTPERIIGSPKLDCLSAAERLFKRCFKATDPTRETFWVAHVDEQGRLIHLSRHDGDESSVNVPLRTIFRAILEHGSAGVLLAHNHPTGNPRPSMQDYRLTRDIAAAVKLLECRVLDHLILGDPGKFSFCEAGLL